MDGDQPSGSRIHGSTAANRASAPQRCPRCGSVAPLIYVHGHAQCTACGSNILDCCQGAACDFAQDRATAAR